VAAPAPKTGSAVPDVLAPGLGCVFCGINPGRVSAAAAAHFANPRNDFWRLLHDAGFTPRLFAPHEQFELLQLGIGVTNAAYRTTAGSGDLRRGDFDPGRLVRIASELAPGAIALVGKEAYRGLFGERPELGPQLRTIGGTGETGLFVLPSTSPANAAVPYAERLRWFRELRTWSEPEQRDAVRAAVLDEERRVLLVEYVDPGGDRWWGTPGGGKEPGETDEAALRRELLEETGLAEFEVGPLAWERTTRYAWNRRLFVQQNRTYVVRIREHAPAPTIDLESEGVAGSRWWRLEELEAAVVTVPRSVLERLRTLLA